MINKILKLGSELNKSELRNIQGGKQLSCPLQPCPAGACCGPRGICYPCSVIVPRD